MDNTVKKGLVLEGGGILGTCYAGALKQLDKLGYKFDYFIGSSIGSIVCALMACRCDSLLLEKKITEMNYKSLSRGNVICHLTGFIPYWGWYNITNLRQLYFGLIESVTGNGNITFQEVYEKYGTHLCIPIIPLNSIDLTICDRTNFPNKKIVEACVDSSSVPFLFRNHGYLDAGLLDNYPIKYMNKLIGSDKTLGLKFCKDKSSYVAPTNFYDFCKVTTELLLDQAFKLHLCQQDWKNTIPIHVPDISAFNFEVTNEEKQQLIKCGEEAVLNSRFAHQ